LTAKDEKIRVLIQFSLLALTYCHSLLAPLFKLRGDRRAREKIGYNEIMINACIDSSLAGDRFQQDARSCHLGESRTMPFFKLLQRCGGATVRKGTEIEKKMWRALN
jgi:hypothetical protein